MADPAIAAPIAAVSPSRAAEFAAAAGRTSAVVRTGIVQQRPAWKHGDSGVSKRCAGTAVPALVTKHFDLHAPILHAPFHMWFLHGRMRSLISRTFIE